MGIIRIYAKSSKPKRKPGWQAAAQQEAEWLARINSMKLAPSRLPLSAQSAKAKTRKVEAIQPISPTATAPDSPPKPKELVGGGTKPVYRPELVYRDDPEMLERELKARQRKFNVAPAYNKGPDIFVTEEDITNQLVGGRRRS